MKKKVKTLKVINHDHIDSLTEGYFSGHDVGYDKGQTDGLETGRREGRTLAQKEARKARREVEARYGDSLRNLERKCINRTCIAIVAGELIVIAAYWLGYAL